MLRYGDLVGLEQALRGRQVLSVYVRGEAPGAPASTIWRREVEGAVARLRASLSHASAEESAALARCVQWLDGQLLLLGDRLRAPGWAAFITPDGVKHSSALPVPMPSLVAWERGARIAPYIRALKEWRPVLLALAEARQARIFRYQAGELRLVATLRESATGSQLERVVTDPLRTGTGAGARTDPRRAADSRASTPPRAPTPARATPLVAAAGPPGERARVTRDLAERLVVMAGQDGYVVIGGADEPARAVAELVLRRLPARALRAPLLAAAAPEAELKRAAGESASKLRRAADLALVADLVERARADGQSTVGVEPTMRALREQRVQELYFTRHAAEEHPREMEDLVRAAFEQRAVVEMVSGAGAERLDRVAAGVGARLRFALGRG